MAVRTVKKFVRTPALIVAGTAQGVLFLLIFRYVFGGAVAHTGGLSYVDFLVPGFVVTGVLFQGMSASSGVAEDLQGGLFDRLRSLPIRLVSIVTGRVGADSALVAWGVLVMTAAGFAVGFRIDGSTAEAVAAFGLTVVYGFAFVWLFIAMGLFAGSPAGGAGALLPGLSPELRVLRLRARLHHARLDARLRQQPAHDPHVQHRPAADRRPGRAAAARPPRLLLPVALPGLDRRDHSRVRPARHLEAEAIVTEHLVSAT